jgi:hypothetical protein
MNNEQDNTPTLGNFGIQDTMNMGLGNASALDGFLDSGNVSATPDDITPIIKEATPPTKEEIPLKGKTIVPEVPGEKPSPQSVLDGFLGSEEDEDESDASTPPVKKEGSKVTDIIKGTENDDAPTGESKFEALANDLYNLGVFTKNEDDESETAAALATPEAFLAKFEAEKKNGAIEMVNNFIGQFGDDYQEMFDAIFVKGVNPKEYLSTYENIISFSDLDLSVESNQESVVRQGLLDQGFDPEDIDTEVERYKTYGDLETVANKIHKVLIKKESTKLADLEVKSEQALQAKAAVREQYVNNVQTILTDKLKAKEFDGIPLNPKIASEVQDFLLVDKYKTSSGETLTDFDKAILEMKRPENHAQKVKLALLLKLLEKDPTLSTIQKSGVTKNTNVLFNSVARQQTKEANNTPQPPAAKVKSWFD